jgi:hypothetical protein
LAAHHGITELNDPFRAQVLATPLALVIRPGAARGRVKAHLALRQIDVQHPLKSGRVRILLPAVIDQRIGAGLTAAVESDIRE